MNKIKELREQSGMKQLDLAKALNISQGTLSNWERGVHDPDSEALLFLAKTFNTTIDNLLGKPDTPSPQPMTPKYNLDDVEYGMINKIGKLNKRDKALISSMVDQLLSDE